MAPSRRTIFIISSILLSSALVLCILDHYYPTSPDLPLIIGFIGISANMIQIYSFFYESNAKASNEKRTLELREELEDIENIMIQKMDKHELVKHILSKLREQEGRKAT